MLDPQPRSTRCRACGSKLPDSRGKQGRPRDYCAEAPCQKKAKRFNRIKACRLCKTCVLFQDERMSGVCRPCRAELAEVPHV